MKTPEKRIVNLEDRPDLAGLVEVAWFWEHHEQIDPQADEWWTPAFRVQKA